MYTVIRFIANPDYLERLTDIGMAMNAIRKGVYAGLRKAGDGFCCEICTGREWGEHQREILRFMTEFGHSISTATQDGAVVTVDVAVEPEDRESAGSMFVLRCKREVLAALSSCGAELELSIY